MRGTAVTWRETLSAIGWGSLVGREKQTLRMHLTPNLRLLRSVPRDVFNTPLRRHLPKGRRGSIERKRIPPCVSDGKNLGLRCRRWGGGGGIEVVRFADEGGGAIGVVTENYAEVISGGLVEQEAALAVGVQGADVVGRDPRGG